MPMKRNSSYTLMGNGKVAIVILQWNNAAETIACIRSVLQIDYPSFEILLVDNGSREDELAAVRAAFPELISIENGVNLGFAEGNNVGMRAALQRGAEYILLLNNDTVVDRHLLHAFVSAARQYPTAGVFGAKIYYFDEPLTLWYAGGDVHPRGMRCYHEGCTQTEDNTHYAAIRETGYACGCALFVKREVIERVGMMTPEFFLIWEEIDWCWRIRKAGYGCLFVPEAKVWHKISSSFEEGNRGPLWQYFYFRNRLLFIERHVPWKKRLSFYTRIFLPELIEMIRIAYNPQAEERVRLLNRYALKGVRDYALRRFKNPLASEK